MKCCSVASLSGTGGLAFGLPAIIGVIGISDIVHSFANDKSSPTSQLMKGWWSDLQKLLKYFNGTTTFASNILLLFGVLPINFVFYSKDLLVVVLLLFILLQAALFSFASSFISAL